MPKVSADYLAARREHILSAAAARFSRDGFHRTSMQDIIDEAGLSAGAVYRYFRGKDEIIAAISLDAAGAVAAIVRGALETRRPAAEVVAALPSAL
ncbi:helix-turn-helix domain-containing protein, partial [Streptomonospora algeriensis]